MKFDITTHKWSDEYIRKVYFHKTNELSIDLGEQELYLDINDAEAIALHFIDNAPVPDAIKLFGKIVKHYKDLTVDINGLEPMPCDCGMCKDE